MKLQTIFQPRLILSRNEVSRGLRALTWEGVVSTGFSSLTTSTFLVAFALALGANNFQIGVLASIPFITDLFQIPAVWLVEKLRQRKAIVLVTWLVSQLLWIPIALIPIVMEIPGAGAISILLGLMALRGILNALTNCGWNSWMRDLVPRNIFGRYFARRLSLATSVAVVLGLSAGYFLDYWNAGEGGAVGYSFVLLIGLVFFGLASPALMAFIPEPVMPPATGPCLSFSKTITTPLREPNYRHFMKFLTFWGFASNMAIPFFAVFMLNQLNLALFTVIALTIVSEVFIVISLRFWGPCADRFGSKTVLQLSTSLFLLVLLGWTFTAFRGPNDLVILALIILHVLDGIAVAGITLTVGTLSFKLAPHGRATPYLAVSSLADSAGTGLGALTGGFLADFFGGRVLTLGLSGQNLMQSLQMGTMHVTGFGLLFALAFIAGLLTIRALKSVSETGVATRRTVLQAIMADRRRAFHKSIPVLESGVFSTFLVSKLGRGQVSILVSAPIYRFAGEVDPPQMVQKEIRLLQKKPPPCIEQWAYGHA
ncbi:MAG: MFS transporter [Dehalococcoidales bacterium]|nr:MFS transporter [Dehalococcoidales bacterium]